jgi:amino acid transporter
VDATPLGVELPLAITASAEDGGLINIPALLICLLVTWILGRGAKTFGRFELIVVAIKIALILFIIGLGIFYINTANYDPFMPAGFGPVLTGAAFLAGVFPIRQVADLTNIGILSAFVVVCLAVIIFRYTRPDAFRTFRLPLMPVVPAIGVLASLFLILQLQWQTWVRFAVWLVIGLIIYFAYGRKHSLLSPDSPLHERAPASGTQQ